MAEQQFIMTQKGYEEAVKRLKYLQTEKRQEIVDRITEARSHGDLSENAEYDAAKDAQATMEERISKIEEMLKNAVVVDVDDIATDVVGICSKVKVFDEDFEEEETYTIVGSTEADPDSNKISDESPIGRALMGRKVGEVVSIETPGGVFELKILEISK